MSYVKQQNMQNTEEPGNTPWHQQSHISRILEIPLMSKKLNSVQKYVNSYKLNPRPAPQRNERTQTLLSSNAQRLVYGGKFTPDPHAQLLNDRKCYMKYSPLLQQKTEDKLEQLSKLQHQYEHLKNNLSGNKEVFTSKYTLPLHRRRPRASETQMSRISLSHDQIQKELKKEILVEDGQRYFADLYMMRKDRSEMKDDIQKNRKFTLKEEMGEEKQKERQKYLVQKKSKQAGEKKNKMLKNKGLHWNVYYEMLALSRNQKERIKGSNSTFVTTFGVD